MMPWGQYVITSKVADRFHSTLLGTPDDVKILKKNTRAEHSKTMDNMIKSMVI